VLRVVAQCAGGGDERRIIGDIHPGQPQMVVEAAGHARGEGVARAGQHRAAGPQCIGGGGVRVVRMRVEEQVGQWVAGQVLRMRQLGHEHQPRRVQAGSLRGGAQAGVGLAGAGQQPQHAAGHGLQHCEGAAHAARVELVAVVEAAEHHAVLGQPALGAGRRRLQRAGVVRGLEGPRKAQDAFAEVRFQRCRQYEFVGDHGVQPSRARGAGVGQPVQLQRGRAHRQHFGRAAAAPAAQVEQQVDALCADAGRDVGMPQCGHLMQPGRGLQAFADAAAIGAVQREQVQLQRRVMTQVFEQGHGQQPGGMGAEAIGKEADAQRAARAYRHCRQGPTEAAIRRARACTGQLLARAGVFAEEGEGFHRTVAGGERGAYLRSQRVHVLPVAQAALPRQALRGDVGFIRHQRMRAAIGRCCAFGIVGVFQRMAQPQRDARVLRANAEAWPSSLAASACAPAIHATRPRRASASG
jgi:hypothetical protein